MRAFAARKTSVSELSQLLQSLHEQKKTDEQVAEQLKNVEPGEQITMAGLNRMAANIPGPLTVEQLTILKNISAFLPLPASDVPALAAPDVAAQKALVAKIASYVTGVFVHLPDLTVQKTTLRFSDNPSSYMQDFRVAQGNGTLTGGPLRNVVGNHIRYLGRTSVVAESAGGVERIVSGQNKKVNDPQGPIAWGEFGPILGILLQDATANGSLGWARWDQIGGKQVAVFSFSVDRKNSHYAVNYCCFPNYDMSGGHIGPSQTIVDWKPFKANEPYHGEFFVDPLSGIVLRMMTQIEPKTTDFVHQEDTRVDYAPAVLGGKAYMLPISATVLTNVVITGEGGGQSYTEVRSILESSYSKYQPLGSK